MNLLIIFGFIALFVYIALRQRADNAPQKPIPCPRCQSEGTLIVDNYVSRIDEQRKGALQSDSDFVLTWKQRWRCQNCGNDWVEKSRERR